MKYVLFSLCVLAMCATQAQSAFESQTDSISYAIGFDIASNIQKAEVPLNPEMIKKGLAAAFVSDSGAFSPELVKELIQDWQQQAQENMIRKKNELAQKNKEEGEAFLVKNGQKEGVMTTPSGLQYIILEEGSGDFPVDTSKVTVHYEGSLLSGEVFDSSYERGEPTSFSVGQVIKGWQEALKLMQAGSTYQLFIPSKLAYGEQGTRSGEIPPHSVLVFKVELIEIL